MNHYPAGQEAAVWQPGDFLLTRGSSIFSRLIRFGERLHFRGQDSIYAKWNHAALVVSEDGQLIEVEREGVIYSPVSKYRHAPYTVVDIDAKPADRKEVVAFAKWCEETHKKAGHLIFWSIAFNLLTGTRLTGFLDGRMICSGMVAQAQERAGSIFSTDTSHIMPADLAKFYDAVPPPVM